MGWLCSDDLLLPGALQRVGEFFLDHPDVDAMYGDSIWIDVVGNPIKPKREMPFDKFVFLHDHNYIPQPSMFWRRALYEAVGGLDETFNIAMDGDLWGRFADRTTIVHVPGPVLHAVIRSTEDDSSSARRPGRALGDSKTLEPACTYFSNAALPARDSACNTGHNEVGPRRVRRGGAIPGSSLVANTGTRC